MRKTSDRPCYKLSADLLQTYKNINELFYEQKRKRYGAQESKKPLCNQGFDDEQGNYIVHVGEEIAGRYIVQVGTTGLCATIVLLLVGVLCSWMQAQLTSLLHQVWDISFWEEDLYL